MNNENKQILKQLLKNETLPNISNKDYVETLGLDNEYTKIEATKLLDSYNELKWWLSSDIKVRAYGQLLESKLIIPFDDMLDGLKIILERPVATIELAGNLDGIRNKVAKTVCKYLNNVNPEL